MSCLQWDRHDSRNAHEWTTQLPRRRSQSLAELSATDSPVVEQGAGPRWWVHHGFQRCSKPGIFERA